MAKQDLVDENVKLYLFYHTVLLGYKREDVEIKMLSFNHFTMP